MRLCHRIFIAIFTVAAGLQASTVLAQNAGPSNLQYSPRPTVSPYLNLFNDPRGVGVYQNMVRPFLQQNDLNAQQNAINNQLQAELNQVRSSTGLGGTGAARGIRPTGHAATYMELSHYYTGARVR